MTLESANAEIRRLRDAIVSARWRLAKGRALWNGPCHECDSVLEGALVGSSAIDPRDPDPTSEGMFRDHNCYRCKDGSKPCVRGNPRACEFPHARND